MLGLECCFSCLFFHTPIFRSVYSGVEYPFSLGRRTWRFVNNFPTQHTSLSTSFAIQF